MKELIPLFTTIVAVAGTLGGVFINNISTTRREATKFKREMLEEIYKTSNEMYYTLIKDQREFDQAEFWLKDMPLVADKCTDTQLEKKGEINIIQRKLKDDLILLESKFDMLVGFYFNDLILPAMEFTKQCQEFMVNRFKVLCPIKIKPEYPDPSELLNAKNEFLKHVKAEIKKLS